MKQLIQCMGMLMLLFGLSSRVSAQITLVKDGKATSRIVLVEMLYFAHHNVQQVVHQSRLPRV